MNPDPIPSVSPPSIDIYPTFQLLLEKIVLFFPILVEWLKDFIGILIGISFPVSLFFVIVIIYTVERLKVIRKKESEIFDLKVVPAYESVSVGDPNLTNKWESVKRHIESPNQNDWKQAILEADIILDSILTAMGYRGESIGEKLKRVEKADFNTLDDAWEAHKVRNQVAHQGNSFVLSQYEAKRVINLYKKVFEEFYYI
jgi:hypothetical protein